MITKIAEEVFDAEYKVTNSRQIPNESAGPSNGQHGNTAAGVNGAAKKQSTWLDKGLSGLMFGANVLLPAYDLFSGNDSLGGTLGNAVGGSLGYTVGSRLSNSLIKKFAPKFAGGRLAGAANFVTSMIGSYLGADFLHGIGDKLAPYSRRKSESYPGGYETRQAITYPQDYNGNFQYQYGMMKTSSLSGMLKKIPEYIFDENALYWMSPERRKKLLGILGVSLAGGAWLGNREYNSSAGIPGGDYTAQNTPQPV